MALFDRFLEKLGYTAQSVTAIGEAANAKGADIDLDTDELSTWPDKIRNNIVTSQPTIGYEITLAVSTKQVDTATQSVPPFIGTINLEV